jgi:predicted Zn-dependent peptidase
MLVAWVTASPGTGRETVEAEVSAQIAALRSVSAEDVQRARNLIESRHRSELQKVEERADQLSMHATLFDDPGRINTEMAKIRAVGAPEIRAFAQDFLHEKNRALLWYVPNSESSQ